MVALQYVNPAFEKMTGYWRSEVVGHPQTLGMNSEHEKPVSSETSNLSSMYIPPFSNTFSNSNSNIYKWANEDQKLQHLAERK